MKRLYRSKSESVIAGICGGIGLTYNIDPTIVRLATVALAIINRVYCYCGSHINC